MTPGEPTPEERAAEPAESVLRTYLARWDAHDMEGMLALLGDGLVFRWGEDGMSAYRENLVRTLAWRLRAAFEITGYELESEGEHTVRASVQSTTRVHELLDLPDAAEELVFWVEAGIIQSSCESRPSSARRTRWSRRYRSTGTRSHR